MKFQTEDVNNIKWMSNPEKYPNVAEEVLRIKNEGEWDYFLSIHTDDEGVVDCDALYEYLWHEGGSALLDVGLHENEATAMVGDVLMAWEEENAPLKVNRLRNGEPSGLNIYDEEGYYEVSIDFESVDENGDVESVSLDNDDVFDLLRDRITCANNATEGAWNSSDPKTALFEMWRGR